ncbi:MAG: phage holin family protein [Acidimicrobiia bacterium]|nr:phage holin family protein [Acidimicrobiia bacterium]
MRFLGKLVIVALTIGLTAALVSGIHVDGGFFTLLWIALVFTVVNLILKPIAKLISLPLIVLTLGLFALVVNAAMLGVTAWLSGSLAIDGFWPAFWGALIISIVLAIAEAVTGTSDA